MEERPVVQAGPPLPDHRSPRVGVGIVIRRGGRLLLVRRKNVHGEGTWSTPGGHLDFGEAPAACAVREAAEETGLVIEPPVFLGVTNDVFDDERHYVTLWFEAFCEEGDARIAAPHELDELGWFDAGALPAPLFPPLQRLLSGDALR